jgi:prepilin-type N-terminal cleavage/methylation domain-containing protein
MSGTKIRDQSGFTLVELTVAMFVLSVIVLSVMGLFTSLVKSALYTKRKAVALTLATNQMEYLKSLSYDSLAVVGGSIYAPSLLPSTKYQTINGVKYTIVTKVDYVDDAFDGCGSYPTPALKIQYCRNYPPPTGAPSPDQNAADYKIIHISGYDSTGTKLAEVDTQVSARVAETASTTGALFVSVIDGNGNPVVGATVNVTNATIVPNVAVADSTDISGNAIFYGLPPDTSGYDYVVTASYAGYSTLATIPPSGTLQPNYQSQQIFTQLSSFVTLTIKPQGNFGLLMETTDTTGAPLGNVKVYAKGGYKKYNLSTNTAYYYDNFSPDNRTQTDSGGLSGLTNITPGTYNLVPGTYIFCGDLGASNCTNAAGTTTYYLAAAVPYTGTNPFNPVTVPTYLSSSPPSTTFAYSGNNYLQKVRLMLTTLSGFPRVFTLSPNEVSLASTPLSSFAFTITGANLPCSNVAASCSTTVKFLQDATTYTASCTGPTGSATLNCTINLTGITAGQALLQIKVGTYTLTLPGTPLLGGLSVTP